MENLGSQLIAAVQREFSDIGDVGEITQVLVRLSVAMLLSGLIGYDRERHGHSAGLRTHMLVGLGSAIVVLIPAQAGASLDQISRVIQGLLAGIGFLGAGAIIKLDRRTHVHGLTTAASLWVVAAIGVAAGLGREWTAIISTIFVLLVLAALLPLERRIAHKRRQKPTPEDDELP